MTVNLVILFVHKGHFSFSVSWLMSRLWTPGRLGHWGLGAGRKGRESLQGRFPSSALATARLLPPPSELTVGQRLPLLGPQSQWEQSSHSERWDVCQEKGTVTVALYPSCSRVSSSPRL